MKDPTEEKINEFQDLSKGLDKAKALEKLDSLVTASDKLAPLMKGKSVPEMGNTLNTLGKRYNLTPALLKKLEDLVLDRNQARSLRGAIDKQKYSDMASRRIEGPHRGLGDFVEDDVIHMGQMLYAETSWARNEVEHEAIIQVAINRAAKKGKKVYDVVKPTTANWNNGPIYKKRFNDALAQMNTNPRWETAKRTIIKCFSGNASVNIGDTTHFLHPKGMKERRGCEPGDHGQACPENPSRMCYDFNKNYSELGAGVRCLPKWAIHVSQGGKSKTRPKLYGKALVSYGTVGGFSSSFSKDPVKTKSSKLSDGIVTNNSNSSIIAIGDSITAAQGSWADRLGIKKIARGAWSSTAIKNKIFYKFLFDPQTGNAIIPDMKRIIILAGINNISNPLEVRKDLEEMAKVAQKADVLVSIIQLLPSAGYSFRGFEKNHNVGKSSILKNIESVNDWIAKESWVKIPGSGAVISRTMGDSTGRMVSSSDGIHPNSQGQIHLNKLVKKQIS